MYMSANIQRGIVEYFFLQQLPLLIFIHFLFQKVKGSISFLDDDGLTCSLLLLEDTRQVFIIDIIFAAVHNVIYIL